MRLLVTGASGFLGGTFAAYALAQGATIGLFVRPSSPLLRLSSILDQCTLFHGDVRDKESIIAAIKTFQPDCIIHCASTLWVKPGQKGQAEHFEINAVGTLNLLEACRDGNIKLIFTGSSTVYGDGSGFSEDSSPYRPNSVYGISKVAVSELIKLYGRQGCPCAELRVFAPYGPLDSPNRLIQLVIDRASRNESLSLTSGRQKRDWVYAGDVADALWRAAQRNIPPGSVINIGSGKSISIKETVTLLLSVMQADAKLAMFGAQPDRPDEMYDNGADISKARQLLEWQPKTALADGLAQTVAWIRAHADTARQLH